jgi:hypothetical protein
MARSEPQFVETLKAPLLAKPQKAFAAAFVVLATVLAGCASGLGVNSYDSAAIGAVTRVEEGHVVAVRPVDAAAAETGFAYTIKLRTGELVSVSQPNAYEIQAGTPVVIEYGQRARVIPQNASIGYT